jgi:hypothetical protein
MGIDDIIQKEKQLDLRWTTIDLPMRSYPKQLGQG